MIVKQVAVSLSDIFKIEREEFIDCVGNSFLYDHELTFLHESLCDNIPFAQVWILKKISQQNKFIFIFFILYGFTWKYESAVVEYDIFLTINIIVMGKFSLKIENVSQKKGFIKWIINNEKFTLDCW